MIDIGRVQKLLVRRLTPHGAILALGDGDVLLPNREVPEGLAVGGEVAVFLHTDSEDRPVASFTRPKLLLGEVTFLSCVDVTSFGAFFDWGLGKQLLVSKWEQTREVMVGDRHPIGLVVDDRERLAGTMRVAEMLERPADLPLGTWVEGEAWRKDGQIGLFVILQRRALGLLPTHEQHTLARGDVGRFRVAQVLPDGKTILSLRKVAHEQLDEDAERILAMLRQPYPPRIGDHSDPDAIRAAVGLSKKAFKRALGGLLRRGLIAIEADGTAVLIR